MAQGLLAYVEPHDYGTFDARYAVFWRRLGAGS